MADQPPRKKQSFFSFAAPAIIIQQMGELVKLTGESKGALIKRLISQEYVKLVLRKR
jgi:hypothetical protein